MAQVRAFCTQCRSRCGCIAVVEGDRLAAVLPDPAHPTGAKLCPKGRAAPELVHHPDRLTAPLRRTAPKGAADPGWRAISWDEALDEIATRLRDVRQRHGAEQVAFSVTTPSGSHLQDSIAWIERFIRAYGSPNTIYATEICNWHKDHATRFTFGHDIGTPDFAHTDCILLWGNNPAVTWLARVAEIQGAVRRGARMVVVDPRPTAFARQADCWLQVRPGTDQALALGLAHLMIAAGSFDAAFMRAWTNAPLLVRADTGRFLRQSDVEAGGSDQVFYGLGDGERLVPYDAARGAWLADAADVALVGAAHLRTRTGEAACHTAFELYATAAAEWPPQRVAAHTGVDEAALRQAAALIGGAASVAYFAWNGIGQSVTATQTDRALTLLVSLTGSVGAQGGNVPGGAARFGDISGADLMSAAQRDKALGLKARPLGPGRNGWVTARDVYRAVLHGDPYPVRMLVSFGTNLLASQPDTGLARQALERLEFHVHADFFLNPTAAHADIVLPAATSWEREGLRTGFDTSLASLKRVQLRPAVVAPRGAARSDTDIVLGLADRLGMQAQFFHGSADAGHDEVLAPAGLSVAQLRRQPEGVDLPGEVALRAYAQMVDGRPRGFATPTRRVEVYSETLLDHGIAPLPVLDAADLPAAPPGYPLRLGAAKVLAFCHSQHRNLDSLRRLMPDPQAEIAPETARQRGIANGDWIRIRTPVGSAVARARISRGLAEGAVCAQHGWWVEGAGGTPYDRAHPLAANLNQVIDTARDDPVSGSIPLRASWCEVEPIAR
ncbi:MAG: molybdopterin-dependent oxidoreductase [Burkholderiales bacterium]|nr:molybdopterin-dependent oxidoreductase [Burkholderiales bacterium]